MDKLIYEQDHRKGDPKQGVFGNFKWTCTGNEAAQKDEYMAQWEETLNAYGLQGKYTLYCGDDPKIGNLFQMNEEESRIAIGMTPEGGNAMMVDIVFCVGKLAPLETFNTPKET